MDVHYASRIHGLKTSQDHYFWVSTDLNISFKVFKVTLQKEVIAPLIHRGLTAFAFFFYSDPNLQTAVLSCLRMVVCVYTPLPEVVELMRPNSTEYSSENRSLMPLIPDRQALNYSSTSSNSGEMIPGLQLPPDSPWLVNWCIHCVNGRDNSLVVRLESLQFLASFLKSYVFLAR